MPAAADTLNHHESDSEDDLDYVPEGEERGMIYFHGLVVWEFTQSHAQDSDTEEERDTKRPRVENSPLAPENSAAAKRYGPRLFLFAYEEYLLMSRKRATGVMGQVPRLGIRAATTTTGERAQADDGQNREATSICGGGRRVSLSPFVVPTDPPPPFSPPF